MKKRDCPASVDYRDLLREDLKDLKFALGYLNVSLEESRDMPEVFLSALREVVSIHGVSMIAEKTNLNRENLYRMLSRKGNPRFSSLMAVLDALGLCLSIGLKPMK